MRMEITGSESDTIGAYLHGSELLRLCHPLIEQQCCIFLMLKLLHPLPYQGLDLLKLLHIIPGHHHEHLSKASFWTSFMQDNIHSTCSDMDLKDSVRSVLMLPKPTWLTLTWKIVHCVSLRGFSSSLRDQGEGAPGSAGAGSAPHAVHVVLGVDGDVIIDHHIHRWDIQAPAGHVCRDRSHSIGILPIESPFRLADQLYIVVSV